MFNGPSIVKKYFLTEGSGITLPPNAERLFAEVVMNDDGEEILELWLAIPAQNAQQAPNAQTHTIYQNTVIYDEDAMADLDEDDDEPIDEASFRQMVERDVRSNLEGDHDY